MKEITQTYRYELSSNDNFVFVIIEGKKFTFTIQQAKLFKKQLGIQIDYQTIKNGAKI